MSSVVHFLMSIALDATRVPDEKLDEKLNVRKNRRNLWLAMLMVVGPLLWTLPTFYVLNRNTIAVNEHCASNMQRINKALTAYATQHEGRFPPAERWVDELMPLVGDASVFHCPGDKSAGRSSYALNAHLSGRKRSEIKNKSQMVLLYETEKTGQNPSGIGEEIPGLGKKELVTGGKLLGGRHNKVGYRFNHYLFADGSLRTPTYVEDAARYRW